MQPPGYLQIVLIALFIASCSNTGKPSEQDIVSNDSIPKMDTSDQKELPAEKINVPLTFPKLQIQALLVEGTYIDGELPFSLDGGNWYALMGKEGGVSEI